MRALLSVSDKSGLIDFARGLADLGIELISTGGTYAALANAEIPVTAVSDVTGSPEMLDGRVKTLHPRIHGGILADRSLSSHIAAMQEHGIRPIDLVVVNLYPFQQAAAAPDSTDSEVIEMIDIGGPTMVRAAAKNHAHVTIVVDPGDYAEVLEILEADDAEALAGLRRRMAAKAFDHTHTYDGAIAAWFTDDGAEADAPAESSEESSAKAGERLTLELENVLTPRYGENPHQGATVYRTVGGPGLLGGFTQHQGKELSYNNLLDANAARRLVARFDDPTVAIIKHNNPCGVGCGDRPAEAYERALACDPVSAFGSIVALNRAADAELAEAMASLFVEVILAPAFEPEALEVLAKKKNLRVLETPLALSEEAELRGIEGGFLAQDPDIEPDPSEDWTCATERQPSEEERRALALAWRVVREVRSNAIVVANAIQTVGIGAGQMSRVDSCRIAIDKAQLPIAGTAAGSDAFFPFPDGVEVLADAGVTAIVQPGGSKRDPEVISAAEARGLTMLMTGRRHFRH